MKKLLLSVSIIGTTLQIHSKEILWQKDIKSSTHDFLRQITTTIDQQYLIKASSL